MEIIGGRHAVLEALRSGRTVIRVLLAAGLRPGGAIAELNRLAEERGVPIEIVPRGQLDQLYPEHQGVAAEVAAFTYVEIEDMLELASQRGEFPLLLLLDMIQDPQNFGSLLRTAEAVGAHGVIIPKHRAVSVTPAVVKASAGAVHYLLVSRVTNLARTMEGLKEKGIWAIGLEASGELAYDEIDYSMPLVLVVGSEARGISRLVREKCDILVRLPMRGRVGSLNAAVAGSIALYHAWRQRTRSTSRGGRQGS